MRQKYFVSLALLLTGLLSFPSELSSCSLAYEQRYHVIGSMRGELVLLETRMRRDAVDSHSSNPKVFWTGDFVIVRKKSDPLILVNNSSSGKTHGGQLKGKEKTVKTLATDFRFEDEQYAKVLDSMALIAKTRMSAVKGFVLIASVNWFSCEPSYDCAGWHIQNGSGSAVLDQSKTGNQCIASYPSHVRTAANWLSGDISTFSFNLMGYTRVLSESGNYTILRLSGGGDYPGLQEALKTRTSIVPKEVHFEHGICFELLIPD
jgi:hypothetical protein